MGYTKLKTESLIFDLTSSVNMDFTAFLLHFFISKPMKIGDFRLNVFDMILAEMKKVGINERNAETDRGRGVIFLCAPGIPETQIPAV